MEFTKLLVEEGEVPVLEDAEIFSVAGSDELPLDIAKKRVERTSEVWKFGYCREEGRTHMII